MAQIITDATERVAEGLLVNAPFSRLYLSISAPKTASVPVVSNRHRTTMGSVMTSAPLRVSGAAAASDGQVTVSEDRCRPVRLGHRRRACF